MIKAYLEKLHFLILVKHFPDTYYIQQYVCHPVLPALHTTSIWGRYCTPLQSGLSPHIVKFQTFRM